MARKLHAKRYYSDGNVSTSSRFQFLQGQESRHRTGTGVHVLNNTEAEHRGNRLLFSSPTFWSYLNVVVLGEVDASFHVILSKDSPLQRIPVCIILRLDSSAAYDRPLEHVELLCLPFSLLFGSAPDFFWVQIVISIAAAIATTIGSSFYGSAHTCCCSQ